MLTRNKSKIAYQVYRAKGFTTDDINNWYKEFENNNNEYLPTWLVNQEGKKKEFGRIRQALGTLISINDALKCVSGSNKLPISYMHILGIIDGKDYILCTDKHDIIKYFPGYFEKKELWDYWRIHTVNHNTFSKIVRGQYPDYLKDRKKQKEIEDAWKF